MEISLLAVTFLSSQIAFIAAADQSMTPETLQNVQIEINDLKEQLRHMNQKMLAYHDKCDITDGERCYFGIFVGNAKMNQDAARLMCERHGARPGNIYSNQQYNDVMAYLRRWISSTMIADKTSFGIRTGMQVVPKSGVVYLSDGSTAPFVKWQNGNPTTNSANTALALGVNSSTSNNNGMHNNNPQIGNFGVLCEISV